MWNISLVCYLFEFYVSSLFIDNISFQVRGLGGGIFEKICLQNVTFYCLLILRYFVLLLDAAEYFSASRWPIFIKFLNLLDNIVFYAVTENFFLIEWFWADFNIFWWNLFGKFHKYSGKDKIWENRMIYRKFSLSRHKTHCDWFLWAKWISDNKGVSRIFPQRQSIFWDKYSRKMVIISNFWFFCFSTILMLPNYCSDT